MGGKGLTGLWLSAAALAACGQAFSAGTASDGGAADSALDSAAGDDAGQDGGSGDAPADAAGDTVHADAKGSPDAPATPDATSDGSNGHDAIAGDAVAGDGPAKDAIVVPPKRVFVTSNAYSGSLGGLAGADGICQDLASKALLDGTYKAWLSSTTTSAASRMTHPFVPYVLVTGVVVANGWDGLTSGTLLNPIDVDEKGGQPPAQAQACAQSSAAAVWTSTAPNGSLATTQAATCADWTSSGSTNGAVLGFTNRSDVSWTDGCASQGAGSTICGSAAAVYCIEQ
jgi:hypothetical protein